MFGWLRMIVFWGLIISGAVHITRRLSDPGVSGRAGSNALNMSQERYTRGELSNEEFEAKRRRLLDS